MGTFSERQKSEIKNIVKEISSQITTDLIKDADFIQSLSQKIAEIVSSTVDKKIKNLQDKVEAMEYTMRNIRGENEELHKKIDYLEQRSKRNQLRLYGVTEKKNENIRETVQQLLEEKFDIDDLKLDKCYRIGVQNKKKSKSSRAIAVWFADVSQRNKVFFDKKVLKGSGYTITEELTKNQFVLFTQAREKYGNNKVWTMDGNVFAEINGKKTMIKTLDEKDN